MAKHQQQKSPRGKHAATQQPSARVAGQQASAQADVRQGGQQAGARQAGGQPASQRVAVQQASGQTASQKAGGQQATEQADGQLVSGQSPTPSADAAALQADEQKLAHTSRVARWATLAVLVVALAVCLLVPSVREVMGNIFALLSSGDTAAVASLIRGWGPWAAGVSFLLMILQSIAAPIPAFLITFANAAVFGWWQGAILSWASAMAGAALCFYIARFLGRDAVAYFVSNTALKSIDQFFIKYGKNAILICRLLPFMSFDYVSYAAGLTGMSFLDFFIATGVGQLPATLVYSYVGGMLTGSVQVVVMALLIMFALFALVFLIRQMYKARHANMMEENQDGSTRLEKMTDSANQ